MTHRTPNLLLAAMLVAAAPMAFAQSSQQHHENKTTAEQAQDRSDTMDIERPDAWVLTKVKAQFAASDTVDASDIDVDVNEGVVRLTGTVAGDAEQEEAIRLARTTEGVKSVDTSDLVHANATTAADAREIEEDDR